MENITKKTDTYALKSAQFCKECVAAQIKTVFKQALVCIEMRFGSDFDGYEQIRKEILRSGNDAIRNVGRIIDEKFNVEAIPDVITIRMQPRQET